MSISPGTTLRELRERKPLVHQITNYVVMNETANATLALGALPVMAHAPQEVEEMVGLASALVINIGTLSDHWIEAMLLAGHAANARGIPVVLDPVGVGATAYRTDTARRILDEVDVTVLRGNQGEVATLVGAEAEVRGVESMAVGLEPPALARGAAQQLGARRLRHRPDRPRLGRRAGRLRRERPSAARRRDGNRLHLDRAHRLLPRREAGRAARGRGRGARRARSRRRGRRRRRGRARDVPRAALRRARGARPGHGRRARQVSPSRDTLGEVGEFELLAELERRGLVVGVEHDAAEIGGLVVTQDTLVEGVHFRFDLLDWRELGFRAAAVNISDLSASGAEPLALLVSLGCRPRQLDGVLELYEGLERRAACRCAAATRRRPTASSSPSPRSAAPSACRDAPARSRATSSS